MINVEVFATHYSWFISAPLNCHFLHLMTANSLMRNKLFLIL